VGRGARPAPGAQEALSASDPFAFTTIAHEGRELLGPVSGASVDAMLERLPTEVAHAGTPPHVLDIGCGKGEMLARALARVGGRGLGLEPNPAFAAAARARLARDLPAERAVVLEARLQDVPLPEQAFRLAICVGALHAFGDWRDALAGLRRLVPPGGVALLGPGYWKRPPDPAYLGTFGGREDEQHPLRETLALAEEAGWQVLACHESTPDEWDDYEGSYAAAVRAWCDSNPGDPAAAEHRARIARWADGYARWGRDTMGFALVLARRPA
jgi:SAM-dependent methyltransferase